MATLADIEERITDINLHRYETAPLWGKDCTYKELSLRHDPKQGWYFDEAGLAVSYFLSDLDEVDIYLEEVYDI